MGGGAQSSKGKARPLNAKERSQIFDAAMYNVSRGVGAIDPTMSRDEWAKAGRPNPEYAQYESPDYVDPGEARTINGGDYDRLEQALYDKQATGLDNLWGRRRQEVDQSMADRGLWSSGMGEQTASKMFSEEFAPQYRMAQSDATAQRYGLQQNEQNALNQYALSSAQLANAAKSDNALKEYESKWRPFDYAAQLWSGTSGQKSNQSSSGFNFSLM
jgi:hypothetical protein